MNYSSVTYIITHVLYFPDIERESSVLVRPHNTALLSGQLPPPVELPHQSILCGRWIHTHSNIEGWAGGGGGGGGGRQST